jgi:AcrR family transcriptional regulator
MAKNSNKKEIALMTLLDLIAERGIQDAPMSMVADRSGIAIGTMYHHFKNKEEMVEALYALLKEQMGIALSKGIQPDTGIKERFFSYWNNLYKFYSKSPNRFYFLEQCDKHPVVRSKVREENMVHYAHIYAFFEEGKAKGVLREMDTEVMLAFVYGTVVSTVHAALSGKVKWRKDTILAMCTSAWDGVKIN